MLFLSGCPQIYTGFQAKFYHPNCRPIQTLVSHPGKFSSCLPPTPVWLIANKTGVL